MKGFKKESKEELRTSFRRAKKSTASLGNFDKQVEGEKKEKIGGKRKYDSLFNKNEKVIFHPSLNLKIQLIFPGKSNADIGSDE